LEARDHYDIADERDQFEEFVATGRATPSEEDLAYQAWVRSLRPKRGIVRVRLVSQPPTPYTLFEFAYFPDLVAAGEQVRILDRSGVSGLAGPWDQDFWVFDVDTLTCVVAVMDYTAGSAFHGVRVLENAEIAPYLDVREAALRLSADLNDYHWPEGYVRVA